jgi:hypothetical protein
MKTMHLLTIFVIAILANSPAWTAGANWQGTESTKDGVLQVVNPAEPTEALIEIDAVEQWRLGGETDDEDEFFGVIMQIATDDQGNIYLLDSQLHQVNIYTADGEFIRAIGREGEGPGEFRRPGNMMIMPDGNIAVVQAMPGKIVLLSPEGDPIGNQQVPGDDETQFFMGCGRSGDGFVLGVTAFSRGDDGFKNIFKLIRVNPEGEETAQYFGMENKRDFANLVFDEKDMNGFTMTWNVGTDGRVYAARSFDEYKVDVWNADGTPDRSISRAFQSRERSPAEMDKASNSFRVIINGREPEKRISKTDRDIQGMYTRDDGTLWVLSSHGGINSPDGRIGTFDVFDADGRLIRQVQINGEGSIERDGFHFVGDRLYVVTSFVSARRASFGGGGSGDDEEEEYLEPMAIICYDLGPELHGSR